MGFGLRWIPLKGTWTRKVQWSFISAPLRNRRQARLSLETLGNFSSTVFARLWPEEPRGNRIATRHLQFFARREEALDLFESVVSFLRLHAVESERKQLKLIEPSELRQRVASRPLRVYLAETEPTRNLLEAPLEPGRWGWVQVDIPIEQGDTLLLGTIGAKSVWHDAESGLTTPNQDALDLFDRVSKVVRKALKGPMWVRNVKTGAARSYRDLRYSHAAKEWLLQGGKLRQEGVANIEFLISDPSVS